MKRSWLVVLIAVSLFMECVEDSPEGSSAVEEVKSGVYVTNEVTALPLPTSGYDIYLIGEIHGQYEVHLLFLGYLKILHHATGLRDIVVEGPQVWKISINEYVLGNINDASPYNYLTEILRGVRALNDTLPDNEKIRVHPVDTDHSVLTIHSHLQILHQEIGAAKDIQIPSLDEFEEWGENEMVTLTDQLTEVTGDHNIRNELETVKASIREFFATGRIKGEIREEAIAQNIQHVLRELDGQPVLALFGGAHAQKSSATTYVSQSWTQLLTESGISIYSIFATGIRGDTWHPEYENVKVEFYNDPDHILFADGDTLGDILAAAPDYTMVYIDLLSNTSVRSSSEGSTPALGIFGPNTLLIDVFDGIIVFREVTPATLKPYVGDITPLLTL
jgi:hypothetical protein